MKRCLSCRNDLPLDMYYQYNNERGGHHPRCKPCISTEYKAKYAADPERYKEKSAKYAAENRDRLRVSAKAWRVANKQRIADTNKEYRSRHPERMTYNRNAWRAANPEKQRVMSAVEKNRRRARMGTAPGSGVSPSQWREVISDFNGHCAYCNVRLEVPVMEHMDPISRGGYHDVSNIVPVCRSCNGRKHVLTALEFLTGFRLDRKVG